MTPAVQESFHLAFWPLIPDFYIYILAGCWLVFLGFALYKRQKGVWWRGLAALFFLLALANPQSIEEKRLAQASTAIVLVDDSGSQGLADRAIQTEQAIKRILEQNQGLIELKVVHLRELGNQYLSSTLIGGALQQVLQDIPVSKLAGVVVISDGQVHDIKKLQELNLPVPLHLLLSGKPGEKDRRLKIIDAPAFSIVDQQVTLIVRVDDFPSNSPGPLKLHLRQNNLAANDILIQSGIDQPITIKIDQIGQNVIELSVDPIDQELTTINNKTALTINGIRDRLRVLLVSGEPYPGERVWRNLLKSDPAVDLIHFTILRPPEVQDNTPSNELSLIPFPTQELFDKSLKDFDLIIFDRYYRQGLLPRSYFDNIVKYVQEGGALFETSGAQYATQIGLSTSPLGKILPGVPTGKLFEKGFMPTITELGRRHPITASLGETNGQKTIWGRWFRQVEVNVPSGDVLMSGEQNKPLLVVRRVGKGRVAQLMSDHIWLWSRGFEGGGPQAELLRRLAHWLMKEPELEEESLTGKIVDGNLEIVRRSLKNNPLNIDVTGPDENKTTHLITPGADGKAFLRLPASLPGLYRITDQKFSALVANGLSESQEFSDIISTPQLLKPIVDQTTGVIIRLSEYPDFNWQIVQKNRDSGGKNWFGFRARDNYQVVGVDQTNILSPYLLILLGISASFMAWYREGR